MSSLWFRWSAAAIAAVVVLSAGFARADADDMGRHTGDRPPVHSGDDGWSKAACGHGPHEGARHPRQMNPGEASAPAGESFAVKGEVASVSPSRGLLVVDVPQLGRSVNLHVDERSQLFVNGDKVSLASLPPGAEVSATYVLMGDQFVAQRVSALVQDPPPEARAPVPDRGTNASRWEGSVNQSPGISVESSRGTLKNSDVDDRDLPGESFNVTHSTDYDAGG